MKFSSSSLSLLPSIVVLVVALTSTAIPTTNAQFQCTFTAQDESTCLDATADGGNHCVWCSLSQFGFCVSESQAEAMEQQIPGIHCDRYAGSDDDDAVNPPADDDDAIVPTDDTMPDDFWTCLQNANSKACLDADCVWCDTKAGFGLCMTGPTAESAANSDWFTCRGGNSTHHSSSSTEEFDHQEEVASATAAASASTTTSSMTLPYDPTCMMTLFTTNTDEDAQSACLSTTDMDGNACEWCNLAGQADLCLTHEQAEMGAAFGLACSSNGQEGTIVNGNVDVVDDPYDPSCALAFLQDQTKEACLAAVDQDGKACEYCTLQGALALCLTEEQAEYGQAMGIECETVTLQDSTLPEAQDPLDTACALAFLQDQSKEGCEAAVDQDGRACEWCDLPGSAGNICLNADQAEMAEQFGITCSENSDDGDNEKDKKLRGVAQAE